MDPEQVLPGARSVIVLAMNYWQGEEGNPKFESEIRRRRGRFARYAWGDDYHDLIEGRLRELDRWLAGQGGTQKCYVDTGPVLERDFAALAGAGWHGKSTMLISRELGTWFFLAEILTTLDFPPDEPARDRCGSCTRCITACPTGAIDAPHHLDARRCISYLTIELKGAIPEELRPLIGDRDLRLRRLPDRLPVEPVRAGIAGDGLRRAGGDADVAGGIARVERGGVPEGFPEFAREADQAPRAAAQRLRGAWEHGHARRICRRCNGRAQDPEPLVREHAEWALARIAGRFGTTVSAGTPAPRIPAAATPSRQNQIDPRIPEKTRRPRPRGGMTRKIQARSHRSSICR